MSLGNFFQYSLNHGATKKIRSTSILFLFSRLCLSYWSVRLPSALAGIGAVYLTYLLSKTLLSLKSDKDKNVEVTSLIAALLLACSPWHIHISRGGYEANLALALGLLGIIYLINFIANPSSKAFYISLGAFTLSMYTYYTTKMFIPLLIIVLLLWGWVYLQKSKTYVVHSLKYLALFFIVCLPIGYLGLFDKGQARFQTINIFANPQVQERVIAARAKYPADSFTVSLLENKYTYYVRDFLEYYFDNLSGQFWYVSGDSSLRYTVGNHGMFYLIEVPFLLIGIILMFKNNKKVAVLLLAWLLLAPLPTSLVGKAYGLRSLAMLPIPMIFVAYGLANSLNAVRKYKYPAIVSVAVIYCISVINWSARYIVLYPTYGQYWYDSMQKEMIDYAKANEDDYDNIILTRFYGKTEMYYAFYEKVEPQQYQELSQKKTEIANTPMVKFGKYYFGDIATAGKDFSQLQLPPRTLVVASPQFAFGTETINAKDDKRILFKVVK